MKLFKKYFLTLLALLPVPSISFGAQNALHENTIEDTKKLQNLKLKEFRSLMFPSGHLPMTTEEAYKKFRNNFKNEDENLIDDVFQSYVEELINSRRLIIDNNIFRSGGDSGIGSPKP